MIDIITFSTNKTLYSQCERINKNISKSQIHGGVRRGLLDFFKDIFKLNRPLKYNNVLVYNTSPKNILLSFFQKLNGKNILFHLHDPKPHSGILNPIIYFLNFIQLIISDKILVFNEHLISQTKSLYSFVAQKEFKVVSHGFPLFNYLRQTKNSNRIKIGFFGRLMPYKNFKYFLEFSEKNPHYQYFIVGDGYDRYIKKINDLKIVFIKGFIDNDQYYSFMVEMDYIFAAYNDISYSGIVNDAICLRKKIIVSNEVKKVFNDINCLLISKSLSIEKSTIDLEVYNSKNGWDKYSSEIIEIINS